MLPLKRYIHMQAGWYMQRPEYDTLAEKLVRAVVLLEMALPTIISVWKIIILHFQRARIRGSTEKFGFSMKTLAMLAIGLEAFCIKWSGNVHHCTYILEPDTWLHPFQLCWSWVLVVPKIHGVILLWSCWTLLRALRSSENKEAYVFYLELYTFCVLKTLSVPE